MKANHKIAAIVVGSFVLALGAASVLHAQAKPPAYVFAEINVKDQDGYTKDYLPKVQAHIKEFGGKYLGGGFNNAVGLSGARLPIAWCSYNSRIWTRPRRSLTKIRRIRRTLAVNTPASTPWRSLASSRSNQDGGGWAAHAACRAHRAGFVIRC